MKKYFFLSFLVLFTLNFLFGEEIKLLVVEKKGTIDLKDRDGKYKTTKLNDILQYGTEIITGFHSDISIKIGEDSYITINQLSSVKITNVLVDSKAITTTLTLDYGYLVIYARPIGSMDNRIIVSINRSNVEFSNSGGEIYMRKDKGSIIKSSNGTIKIGTRLVKTYFIGKNETCAILPTDVLIESDYFLRKKINVKANSIYEDQKSHAFLDYIFQDYTKNVDTNDYSDQVRP